MTRLPGTHRLWRHNTSIYRNGTLCECECVCAQYYSILWCHTSKEIPIIDMRVSWMSYLHHGTLHTSKDCPYFKTKPRFPKSCLGYQQSLPHQLERIQWWILSDIPATLSDSLYGYQTQHQLCRRKCGSTQTDGDVHFTKQRGPFSCYKMPYVTENRIVEYKALFPS